MSEKASWAPADTMRMAVPVRMSGVSVAVMAMRIPESIPAVQASIQEMSLIHAAFSLPAFFALRKDQMEAARKVMTSARPV